MGRGDRKDSAESAKSGSGGALTPAALYEAGLHHLGAGRLLDAQIACEQALATNPNHADSLAPDGPRRATDGAARSRGRVVVARHPAGPRIDYLTTSASP